MGSLEEEKAALRRKLLERRRGLENFAEKGQRIQEAVSALPQYQEAEKLLFYVNLKREPCTERLLEEAWRQGRETYAPRCLPGGKLTFYRVSRWEDLSPGSFGIREPDIGVCPVLQETTERDLCLVPGVAFDREGFRLGYGKGYYDRFLAQRKIGTLGLCYEALLLPRLPRGKWDQRVELVITEGGCIPPPVRRKEVEPQ